MIRKIHKFADLTLEEQKILLKALWMLMIVKTALYILPFQKVWGYYNKQVTIDSDINLDESKVDKIARAVDQVANVLPRTLCLPRALAVHKMLSDNGYHSELKIGTMKDDHGKFVAHAWIEKDDKIIIGNLDNLPFFSTF